MADMSPANLVGQPLPRVEDRPLVQGLGQYVTDIRDPNQWVVAIVRSTHAHARIRSIDTAAAERLPGVRAVLTARSVPELGRPMPGDGTPGQSPLATDRVRYVGEPIAVVAADNRYIAEDAVELVQVAYQALPAVVDVNQAWAADTLLHPSLGSNIADTVQHETGRGSAALTDATIVVDVILSMGRVSAQPMEPRAVFARYLAETDGLLVYCATQSVYGARQRIATFLHLEAARVHVVSPDVGGGFGAKNGAYPEEFLVSWLAYHMQRPIKWSGDRFEEFLATTHEREQVHHAKLGVTRSGHIVALTDVFYQDNGAYPNRGGIPFHHTVENLVGPYVIPHTAITGYMMLTSKVPQAPYRGAGRPQGHFVIERLLDRAADALGMDRADIRRKNLYRVSHDSSHPNYDSGDYQKAFETLLDHVRYRQFRAEQEQAWAEKRYLGLGVASYVEIAGGGGFEGARLTLLDDGRVELATGAVSHGQGHRTALTQLLSDRLSVAFEDVVVREGDTTALTRGLGTFGSRTILMAGNAVELVAPRFLAQLKTLAAARLEAHADDVVWEHGRFSVQGVPSMALSLADLAHYAREAGVAPVVDEDYYQTRSASYGFGCHAMTVQVDPRTADIRILDYVVVHDGGLIINPLLADGQVVGGLVQGLGSALLEELMYDEAGQLLTTSYMDYVLPGACDAPDITVIHQNFPAPGNPAGFKGLGEAGIIPVQAVVLSAVEDALRPFRLQLNHAPITRQRLFAALAKATGTSE